MINYLPSQLNDIGRRAPSINGPVTFANFGGIGEQQKMEFKQITPIFDWVDGTRRIPHKEYEGMELVIAAARTKNLGLIELAVKNLDEVNAGSAAAS